MLSRRKFLLGAGTVLAVATGCSRVKLPSPSPAPPEPLVPEEGPHGFRVALLSDPHTQAESAITAVAINGKLSRAVAEFKGLKPDLWICNGDVSDHGKPDEFAAFKKILAAATKPENLLVNTGNHEFYDTESPDAEQMKRFTTAFGLAQPYSNRVAGGIHFVMLADEQYKTATGPREWAWLTAEQLRWFEKVLAEHKDKFTAVFLHQPLQETVVWSHGGNDFAGCGQVKELQAILAKNRQVKLWFSGHTHMPAELPGQVASRNGVTYVGLGSTFYLFGPSEPGDTSEWLVSGKYKKDLSASQNRFMEVWPDKVVIKTRDHARGVWLDKNELVIKRG